MIKKLFTFVTTLVFAAVMFVLAAVIAVIVHEGGHGMWAEIFGGKISHVQVFWVNLEKPGAGLGETAEDIEAIPWEWQIEPWTPKDWFGMVSWYDPEDQITPQEEGAISVMGSGSTLALALILLAVLVLSRPPRRFPWLGFFLILIGVVDIFTYSVIPMIGQYVRLSNPEQVFDVTCNPEYSPPRRPADFSKPDAPFGPQIRTVQAGCNGDFTLVQMALEFDREPDFERATRLFVQVESPQGVKWLLINQPEDFKADEYYAFDFTAQLPPTDGQYRIRQAFIVLNGLPRLIFFYGNLWSDGFTYPEPLYGAVELNIDPLAFMGVVSAVSLLVLILLLDFILRFRRERA
jgi:hypothetical protein